MNVASLPVGRAIHRLDILIRRYLDTYLDRRSIESVTGNNGRIIAFLADHEGQEVCQRDLETAFGITRSTASKVVRLMEQKGLVARVSVERDARLKRLTLTDKARGLSLQMRLNGDALEERLLRGFAPEERERLRADVLRMIDNLSEVDNRR